MPKRHEIEAILEWAGRDQDDSIRCVDNDPDKAEILRNQEMINRVYAGTVRAVNSHSALVLALREAMAQIAREHGRVNPPWIAALKLAGEEI